MVEGERDAGLNGFGGEGGGDGLGEGEGNGEGNGGREVGEDERASVIGVLVAGSVESRLAMVCACVYVINDITLVRESSYRLACLKTIK